MPMKQEDFEKWIAALRSGKYRKGVGMLHSAPMGSRDDKPCFCCLGVLCQVNDVEVGYEIADTSTRTRVYYRFKLDDPRLDKEEARKFHNLRAAFPLITADTVPSGWMGLTNTEIDACIKLNDTIFKNDKGFGDVADALIGVVKLVEEQECYSDE